ncbi:hypothetical protein FEE96_19765 [Parasedimentitalea maritima]|uniref:Uncharacterized protein n=1 Tax=Parasedimentitalea maritima TaxID=2578117 RepID=A0ABY2UVS5_9RHOB|nr:hypothetical protein [Zongyanglinia marina]TLP57615.1 hypothetical protein FEE96_19765 [Zongyanglinia marina]
MMRIFVLTSLTALALTACGPAPQGVGFTGVGSEPVGLATSTSSADRRLTATQPLPSSNGLPLHHVSSASTSQPVLAAQVMGGSPSATAKTVELVGSKVLVSLAEANGEVFLVGQVPKSMWSQSLSPGADKALLAAVPQLTGCRHQGKVYRGGVSKTQPVALAVPLSCG